MAATARGEETAFRLLVQRWEGQVKAFLIHMLGSVEEAEDLTQETFVQVYRKAAGYQAEGRFQSWLFRIASNKTLNFLNVRREYPLTDTIAASVAGNDADRPDQQMHTHDLRAGVLAFMATLPEKQRLVFNLRFYRQMSFAEIAETTGNALGTVKTNYREAVAKLRTHAKEKGWK